MKKNTKDLLGLFSYIALLIFTSSFILNRIGVSTEFFTYLGYGLVIIVVLVLAKIYVEKLSIIWRVIYYIIAILTILNYFFSINVFK